MKTNGGVNDAGQPSFHRHSDTTDAILIGRLPPCLALSARLKKDDAGWGNTRAKDTNGSITVSHDVASRAHRRMKEIGTRALSGLCGQSKGRAGRRFWLAQLETTWRSVPCATIALPDWTNNAHSSLNWN